MIKDGTLYKHWSDMTDADRMQWNTQWPDFSPEEIACHHCGELLFNFRAMDNLQAFRMFMMGAVHLNSAYRCKVHNDNLGSNDNSWHRKAGAFDVSHRTGHPAVIDHGLRTVGLKGRGYYDTFDHGDIGPPRTWDERT